MFRKLIPWLLFIFCLALLALGATPFGLAFERIFLPLRFLAVIVLSILPLHEKFGSRKNTFFRSITRWARGD